jgi:hypothetical protein
VKRTIIALLYLTSALATSGVDALGSCSQVIYDNTTDEMAWYHPGAGYEVLDFGTSDGGRVCKFSFEYVTTLLDPGTVIIQFYSGTNASTCPGDFLKSYTFTGLPGSSTGSAQKYIREVWLSIDDQFELPSGAFGYSFQFDNSDTGVEMAQGGNGNQNRFWRNCQSAWFGGDPWAGFYMKIYTGTFRLISGYVSTAEGLGIDGVLVSADNHGGSDITDSAGFYELLVLDGWSGAVTPAKNGFTFYPQTRSYNNISADQPNEDYTLLVTRATTLTRNAGGSNTVDTYTGLTYSDYLIVGYDAITRPTVPDYMAGMRFMNVQIPNEALITDAHLKMQNSILVWLPGYPVYGVIHAESSDNPDHFDAVPIGSRPKTSAAVNWDHMDMGGADWWYTSPDISAVVQEVIDRPGWVAGNAMVVFYSTRINQGQFRWFWSSGPTLKMTYAHASVPGDLDDDGDVNLVDLKILADQYLQRVLYSESDGRVVIEAERYFSNHEGSGAAEGFAWCDLTDSRTGDVNYVQALPDDGNYIDANIESDSPHLSYQIDFNTPGPNTTYYLWVKGKAVNSDSNSLHYGLEGVSVSSEDSNALQLIVSDVFTWVSETNDGARPIVIIPSADIYTLDIWMREDGAKIDRILLATDAGYDPGTGEPEESPHQPFDLTGDLNSDGEVNLLDFAIMADNWLIEFF